MSNDPVDAFSLLDEFAEKTLSEKDGELFLSFLKEDEEFVRLFRANMRADFLLREKGWAQKGAPADLKKQKFHAVLSPEELTQLKEVFNGPDHPQESMDSLLAALVAYSLEAKPIHSDPPKPNPSPVKKHSIFDIPEQMPSRSKKRFFSKKTSDRLFIICVLFLFSLITFLSLSEFYRKQKKAAPEETFVPAAKVEEMINAVWGPEGKEYKRGHSLAPGKIHLQSGLVKLRFNNDAELILKGPTDFTINNPKSTFCDRGEITALIPEKAVGFEITTPFTTIIDRGTEFFVKVDEKETKFEVFQGKVDYVLPEQASVPLLEGNAVRADSLRTARSIPAGSVPSVRKGEFQSRLKEFIDQTLARRSKGQDQLRDAPGLLVYLDPGSENGEIAVNRSRLGSNRIPHALMVGCVIGEGFLPGINAAELNTQKSHVELDLPGKYRSLTIILTVRIDRMNKVSNCLLESSDIHQRPGTIAWTLIQDGSLRLFLDYEKNGTQLDCATFSTEAVHPRFDCGVWNTIAVVFNSQTKTITQYFDGKQISSDPWINPFELEPGRLIIGNSAKRKELNLESQLNGALGDIQIYDRALTPEEIKNSELEN
ncbi:MAG: LamG-like jellyroll fold domain-containing protein [Planctomycetia bacterium]|nr:LamG-like jellyroll fold domain-containing protein [Planctomycetia bacterium]